MTTPDGLPFRGSFEIGEDDFLRIAEAMGVAASVTRSLASVGQEPDQAICADQAFRHHRRDALVEAEGDVRLDPDRSAGVVIEATAQQGPLHLSAHACENEREGAPCRDLAEPDGSS